MIEIETTYRDSDSQTIIKAHRGREIERRRKEGTSACGEQIINYVPFLKTNRRIAK